MATQEQIEQIVQLLHRAHPIHSLKHMDESQAGIGAVIRFLAESDSPVTAGSIAEFMNVSTARVAVLLKKMTARGLILKENAPNDARVTIVRLSGLGLETARAMQMKMYRMAGEVIDQLGMDRVLDFLNTAAEINRIIAESDFDPDAP